MNIRTTALIAGGLGLLLLIGGLIAESLRPEPFGDPEAQISASAVVLGPDLLATAPTGSVTITADGPFVAYLGRTEDVDAWLESRDAVEVTGISTWEELSTQERPAASPEPSASASPSPSASASPEPSAEPSDEASAEPTAAPEVSVTEAEVPDLWREAWPADGELTLDIADIPVGLAVAVEASNGASIETVSIHLERVVDDAWITPLKWWGAVLTVVGVLALISLLVDLRGARSRGEHWQKDRRKSEPATEDGRRARREASTSTSGIPVVTQADDAVEDQSTDHEDTPEGEERR